METIRRDSIPRERTIPDAWASGDHPVEEIARMAGGDQVRESTRRHARELIRARSAL